MTVIEKKINSSFEYFYTLNGKLLSEYEYKMQKEIQHFVIVVVDKKYHLSNQFYNMCFVDSSMMAKWRDARIDEILDE